MKNIFFIFIAFLLLTLSSCTKPISDTLTSQKSQPPSKVAKDYMIKIINCFEKRNKAELKELMSDYITANDSQLDNEIDNAFDFIDGKIVSYDEPFGDAMGSYEKKHVAVKLQA